MLQVIAKLQISSSPAIAIAIALIEKFGEQLYFGCCLFVWVFVSHGYGFQKHQAMLWGWENNQSRTRTVLVSRQ